MSAGNSIRREDFASEEQIDRHLCRLRERGDRGQTGNLLGAWESEESARRRADRARADLEFDRRHPELSPAPVLPVVPKAAQEGFDFHARGDDLPLFAS